MQVTRDSLVQPQRWRQLDEITRLKIIRLKQSAACAENQRDFKRAERKLRKAVKLGSLLALVQLGDCFQSRTLHRKAVDCYRQAARRGSESGTYQLARCYLYGLGTKKDERLAMLTFRQATERKDRNALQVSLPPSEPKLLP